MMVLAYFSITNVYFLQNMVYVVVSYSSFLPKKPKCKAKILQVRKEVRRMNPENGAKKWSGIKAQKDIEKNGI